MRFQNTQRPLLLVGMAAAIPLLLFTGWVAYLTATHERAAARTAAFEALDRVSTRLTSEISTQIEVAKALAATASLDQPDLSVFHLEATRLTDSYPLWETVELTDTKGSQVVNVLRPFGAELGPTADLESFQQVLRSHTPAVGGIGPVGPVSGRRLVALRTPVHRDSELRYVLSVHLVPDAVTSILREAGAPPGWIGVVLDGNGNIIARTLAAQFELGRPGSASARQALRQAPSGEYIGTTLEGVEVEAVYRTLPDVGGWSVHLGLPTSTLNAPVTRSMFFLAGGGAVSLVLGLSLAWLTARDIAQRRRDEQARNALALGVSEERRALAVDAADLGTFSWDFRVGEVVGSQRTRDLLALPDQTRQGPEWTWSFDTFLSHIHPNDRTYVESVFRRCLYTHEQADFEFRACGEHGRVRWLRAIGRSPRLQPEGRELVYGVLVDIETKKRAEAERLEMQRQLATARETEQRRIARELHDQIGQTVTGLSLGLKALEQLLGSSKKNQPARQRVSWLQDLTSKIGQDIHQVAFELRPSALDDLGLENAISALAATWSERFELDIDVQVIGRPLQLPPDSQTAIYRIVQEAITNALKHGHARMISVVLECRSEQLRVIIEDDGVGFNARTDAGPTSSHGPRQLGLSGIRERLALIGGTMSIESKHGSGTTLYISIPGTSLVAT